MYGFKKFPACSHEKKDCTACTSDGMCIALEDTDFGKKPCPFYMDRETTQQRVAECSERNLGIKLVTRKKH